MVQGEGEPEPSRMYIPFDKGPGQGMPGSSDPNPKRDYLARGPDRQQVIRDRKRVEVE